VQVVDGLELHVEQVADLAVRVGGVADAVELQVGVAQTGFSGGCFAELLALGELDAVGRGLHAVVADLAGVGDGVEEVRRQRGLAAGELHRHLARGLMVIALSSMVLISSQVSSWTKPTWLASMKQGSHIMLQRLVRSMVSTEPRPWVTVRRAVVVQLLVVVGADVAAGEDLFEVLEEGGVDGHHVFEVAVDGAVLDHQDLAVALDDLRLDLADLLVEQDLVGQLAVDDLLADLGDALGAERVGGARPAEGRLLFLVALEQRLVAPLGGAVGWIAGINRPVVPNSGSSTGRSRFWSEFVT
jgi:hypothetical protein